MVSGISALAIHAGSNRVDSALFLQILNFIGSKLVRDARDLLRVVRNWREDALRASRFSPA
jgi:hypothetical protein